MYVLYITTATTSSSFYVCPGTITSTPTPALPPGSPRCCCDGPTSIDWSIAQTPWPPPPDGAITHTPSHTRPLNILLIVFFDKKVYHDTIDKVYQDTIDKKAYHDTIDKVYHDTLFVSRTHPLNLPHHPPLSTHPLNISMSPSLPSLPACLTDYPRFLKTGCRRRREVPISHRVMAAAVIQVRQCNVLYSPTHHPVAL